MDLIISSFHTFSQEAIALGLKTPEQAMDWLVEMSPTMKQDAIFQDIFPTVFMINWCRHMKALKEKEKSAPKEEESHIVIRLTKK